MKNWRIYNGALIPLTPPHLEVVTSDIKLNILDENVFFARWTTNFDIQKETEFWYVINDTPIDIEGYSKNTRSKIRRGLNKCSVKKISREELMKKGFDSYRMAFLSYNTYINAKTKSLFVEEINLLSNNWEFWGIFHEDKMIGYSQNKIIKDYCEYSTIKFHPKYLKYYPSYALFYTMNKYYLNSNNFKYVNDGARSISHETNIQEFLIQKFKFRKAYCELHLVYSTRIKLLIMMMLPFRSVLKFFNLGVIKKLNILLKQELIRKSFNY